MAYTKDQKEELFLNVLKHISNGMSLRKACKQDDSFNYNIFLDMIYENESKNEHYARACEERALNIFEDCMDIADQFEKDVIKTEDGREIINHHVIHRDKLRVDTRKWFLSKMVPKKYGDKLEIESTNSTEIKGITFNE